MSINRTRAELRRRDQEARKNAKREHRERMEVERLEQVVQKRQRKLNDAKAKLKKAKECQNS